MIEYYGRHVGRQPSSIVTVGTFDGVHRGHLSVLSTVVKRAAANAGIATVVTFDPHPREVTSGDIVPLITTIPERIDLLERLGIERVVVIPFDADFASLSADEYVRNVLFETIGLKEIVIGYDHSFGRSRRGDSELLESLGVDLGFIVTKLPPKRNDETVISSSAIRDLLIAEGDVSKAAELLGRHYSIRGKVVPGDGRGGTLGFPTANISVGHSRKIIPLRGVYAVQLQIHGLSGVLSGMMNVGFRPTFDGVGLRAEVHILDFSQDLYGKVLQIEFVKRIRDERKFDGIDSLREQLIDDEERCRAVLSEVSL